MYQLNKIANSSISNLSNPLTYLLNVLIKLLFLFAFILWAWLFSLNSSHTQSHLSLNAISDSLVGEKSFADFSILQLGSYAEHRLLVLNHEHQVINTLSSTQFAIATQLEQLSLILCGLVVFISLLLWQQKTLRKRCLFSFSLVTCLVLSGCFTLFNVSVSASSSLFTTLGIVSVCFLTYCAFYQRLNKPTQQTSALLAFASQSGTAMSLAKRLYQQFPSAFDLRCISTLSPSCLNQYQHVFFIASTYGEGAPPEAAVGFFDRIKRIHALSQHVNFSILALGDRSYRHFCAFGHQLSELLTAKGATPMTEVVEVDRGDPRAITHWWQQVGELIKHVSTVDSIHASYHSLETASNTQLNPNKPARAAHRLIFNNNQLEYNAGDLLEIVPKHSIAHARSMLSQHGYDSEQTVEYLGEKRPLYEVIRECNWQGERADTAQQLVLQLTPLPPRVYSIASAPNQNQLEILVRRHVDEMGRPGLASQYLCDLQQGETIRARIRPHPNFHLRQDPCPLILIGAGTGIAPLIGLLKSVAVTDQDRASWLFFGEQSQHDDFYFKPDIEKLLEEQVLNRFTAAWSRDDGIYLTAQLENHANDIRQWVIEHNAAIYICGKKQGFGTSVINTLQTILTVQTYQSRVDTKKICVDLY